MYIYTYIYIHSYTHTYMLDPPRMPRSRSLLCTRTHTRTPRPWPTHTHRTRDPGAAPVGRSSPGAARIPERPTTGLTPAVNWSKSPRLASSAALRVVPSTTNCGKKGSAWGILLPPLASFLPPAPSGSHGPGNWRERRPSTGYAPRSRPGLDGLHYPPRFTPTGCCSRTRRVAAA